MLHFRKVFAIFTLTIIHRAIEYNLKQIDNAYFINRPGPTELHANERVSRSTQSQIRRSILALLARCSVLLDAGCCFSRTILSGSPQTTADRSQPNAIPDEDHIGLDYNAITPIDAGRIKPFDPHSATSLHVRRNSRDLRVIAFRLPVLHAARMRPLHGAIH